MNGPKQQPLAYALLDRATLTLTEPTRAQLATKLGAECAARPVPVLILDDKAGFEVVSMQKDPRASPAGLKLGLISIIARKVRRPITTFRQLSDSEAMDNAAG